MSQMNCFSMSVKQKLILFANHANIYFICIDDALIVLIFLIYLIKKYIIYLRNLIFIFKKKKKNPLNFQKITLKKMKSSEINGLCCQQMKIETSLQKCNNLFALPSSSTNPSPKLNPTSHTTRPANRTKSFRHPFANHTYRHVI